MERTETEPPNIIFVSLNDTEHYGFIITHKTTVNSISTWSESEEIYSIYKIECDSADIGCNTTFYTSLPYICWAYSGNIYVINLRGPVFTEEFMERVRAVPNLGYLLTTGPKNTYGTFKGVLDIKSALNKLGIYLPIKRNFQPYEEIDLTHAKQELELLNQQLNCVNYQLRLDYMYNVESNSTVNSYNFVTSNLILCIFDRNNCIASITFPISYDEESSVKYIVISSYTNPSFEGKQLNTLLRSIVILIANKIDPAIYYIYSEAVNPISAYLLMTKFKAVQDIRESRKKLPIKIPNEPVSDPEGKKKIQKALANFIKRHSEIKLQIDVTDPVILENAKSIFDSVVARIECQRRTAGGKRKTRTTRTKRNRSIKQIKRNTYSRKNKHKSVALY